MATLEEALLAKGATGAMLDSKTFKMAKEAVAEGAVDGIADAAEIARKADEAATNIQRTLTQLNKATDTAWSTLRAVNEANDRLRENAASVIVTDPKTLEAINAYTMVLTRTKEVVGDDGMTDSVWEKAIEAASYCAWRTGSNPKQYDQRRPL